MSEFACKRCTACCRLFRLPVKNRECLIKKFEEHFGFKLKSYDIEVIFKGDCEHLKANHQCAIYDKRPELCKNYFCKKYPTANVPKGQVYQKRCLVCGNIRKFQAGTERDKQSVCGNCWVW